MGLPAIRSCGTQTTNATSGVTHCVTVRATGGRPYLHLRMLAAGLREAHGWDVRRVADYLAHLRGALGYWTPADIAGL